MPVPPIYQPEVAAAPAEEEKASAPQEPVTKLDPTGELQIEITDGLKPGNQVVTGPFKTLRTIKDGDRVKAMSEDKRKALEANDASPT